MNDFGVRIRDKFDQIDAAGGVLGEVVIGTALGNGNVSGGAGLQHCGLIGILTLQSLQDHSLVVVKIVINYVRVIQYHFHGVILRVCPISVDDSSC